MAGARQPLEDMEVFAGKIKAAKDTQQDPDFCLVARIEALIAGWGLEEALRRAEAYHKAGADAILIHSKKAAADEILAFAEAWRNTCPVVIVPTRYYRTPTADFRRAGVSLVIWANHLLRSAVAAMQRTAAEIFAAESLLPVESRISTVEEIFRLQNSDELMQAEERYLVSGTSSAAGKV
jgi:phosphoenolpyruvate phosphomutase